MTATDFWNLHESGTFASTHVELLGGEIVPREPTDNWHALAVDFTVAALRVAFEANGYWVRIRATVDLDSNSLVDPDISVVSGSKRSHYGTRRNPTTAVLIVEVSDTTLTGDRERKGSLYAACGIQEYWILNIPDNVLEVRRDPRPDAAQPFGFGYASLTTLTATDFATPLAVPTARIPVADLLPM